MALSEGLEFGCDLDITLEIPFSQYDLFIALDVLVCRKVLPFQRSLKFFALRYFVSIKQIYINEQVFSLPRTVSSLQ